MRNSICRPSHIAKTVFCGAALVVAGVGSAKQASATPSTLGFYPSTDIYGKGTFHLDGDTYGRALKADTGVTTGLSYGIGPDHDGLFGRSEIGADYILSALGATPGISVEKRLLYNAKTQLYNNDTNGIRIVTGVWGVGSKALPAPDVAYLTGSKTFKFGRIHLGVADSFASKAAIAIGTDDDKFSVSAGYDRYITPKLQFAVDYYSGKNAYAGVQPTLYYYVNDKADFGLGLFRLNSSQATAAGIHRNQIYVCFDYNFGGSSAAAPAPVPETAPAAPAAN